jgi:hypothetical protein
MAGPTQGQIADLRRMIAEPAQDLYTDEILTGILKKYPIADLYGIDPPTDSDLVGSGSGESEWTPTYDLHAAAADVWEEKAAAAVGKFDFSADGATYSRNQVYQACVKQAARHKAMRRAQSVDVVKDPAESGIPWDEDDAEEV